MHFGIYNTYNNEWSSIRFPESAPNGLVIGGIYKAERVSLTGIGLFLNLRKGRRSINSLAKAAGSTHKTVSGALSGDTFPRFSTVERLYKAVGGETVLLLLSERAAAGTISSPVICLGEREKQSVKPWLQEIRSRRGPSREQIAIKLGTTSKEVSNFLTTDGYAGVGSIQAYVSEIAGLQVEYCCVQGLVSDEQQ